MAFIDEDQAIEIERQLRRLYPNQVQPPLSALTEAVIEKLEGVNLDIYDIQLSNTRGFSDNMPRGHYFSYKEVSLNGTTVFIRLRVD